MSHGLEPIEVAVLNYLLAGQHPVLDALHAQLEGLRVTRRENTGAGFFTEFTVAPTAVPAPAAKLCFGDVEASIRGLRDGAGFLLYVDRGLLVMLEGYAYEEPWPETITEFAVRYSDPARPSVRAILAKCQA